ncbi:MAG: RagB/SusD family nutrient uptake outer membrane protein [Chitinophagaceae bacterium]|nr:RagB/SusD family nutrient uptake outer membrane protein [Chitinophagaceae bacterium]
MKYIKQQLLFIAVLFMISCQKELEILPEQSVAENVVFTTRTGAQAALNGVYSTAQSINVFGSQPQIMGDFQADNTEFVGSFPTLQEIFQFTTISTNVTVSGWWQSHYQVILRANSVITRVPGINEAGFTEAQKKQMVAEAKFMRALTYFQLVNLFAQPVQINSGNSLGVPLVLGEFTGNVEFPARSTVNQVHLQIKKDLEEAIPDLPASYSTAADTRGRATKGAARGLLSRLHLYRGEWSLAAGYANDIITASPTYVLASNYAFYDGNTAEDVFSIQMTTTDNSRTGAGGWASYHRPAANGGRGDCPYTANLEAAFQAEPGDLRYNQSAVGVAADGISRRFTLKFPDAVNNTDNSPVIRVTEMYLNRAEALAELNGINQTSIDLMNVLRTRAGLPAWNLLTFSTASQFIDAILNERRKELCFEGHRRMDLLRKGKPLRATGPLALQSRPGDNKVILPIPQREIDINPSLKSQQNPGY